LGNRSDSELAQVIKLSGRPVHHGFSPNDKADAVATLPENLTTLRNRITPKGSKSMINRRLVLDDRFREPGIRGTGSVFVDSSFEFCLNEDWYHGNMAARSRVGDDRGGN